VYFNVNLKPLTKLINNVLLVSELRKIRSARRNDKNDYTVFDPTNCITNDYYSFVTYDPVDPVDVETCRTNISDTDCANCSDSIGLYIYSCSNWHLESKHYTYLLHGAESFLRS